ncbi:enoyl-CoA hydratase/isomerase family protein [Aliiglaciecola lipolytica]|uniref:3-hydroxyisobutyryl-CoA hydrolase n=1 Tax=Aliiglaciecola lipolytica E3 TaxID=1127673 RepID=K6Y7M5_9ALTE|nr:enoyl-CoA hydratase/isomerase family protein [Aliiglaciecola lipolytica]GAC14217.1 enoyl-CoA hydratase [Aliiglaciecola lipolytica E3]
MSSPVLFDIQPCENNKFIGIATLNKQDALNAIDLEMVNLLLLQLQAWQQNDEIAVVMIDSRGDKAFCAGGDVVAMYRAMSESAGDRAKGHQQSNITIPNLLETFFSQEYRLDYLIHTFTKPILLWGNGIIMGGGLGLMAGASHRIVTESSRIAMPEASIGLYPDVGGSWFLNKMPAGVGRFLGITGASIDCHDAIYANLADHIIDHADKLDLLRKMKSVSWTQSHQQNADLLHNLCKQFSQAEREGNLQNHREMLADIDKNENVSTYIEALQNIDSTGDKWLKKAQSSLTYSSPITMHLVFEQLRRGRELSLAECFKMELIMSCRCATYGEFQEGVRALLIDKDRNPNWAFSSTSDVDKQTIEQFFESPWAQNAHPLRDL